MLWFPDIIAVESRADIYVCGDGFLLGVTDNGTGLCRAYYIRRLDNAVEIPLPTTNSKLVGCDDTYAVAVDGSTNTAWYSAAPFTEWAWSSGTIVMSGEGRLISGGSSGPWFLSTYGLAKVYYATSLSYWSDATSYVGANYMHGAYCNGVFMFFKEASSVARRTTGSLLSFTDVGLSFTFNNASKAAADGNNFIVAVAGGSNTTVWRSSNGLSWTAGATISNNGVVGLSGSNGRSVCLMSDGTIAYSEDSFATCTTATGISGDSYNSSWSNAAGIKPDGGAIASVRDYATSLVVYSANDYFSAPINTYGKAVPYKPAASDNPTPKTLGALSRRCVPKLGAGKLAHQKIFGAPRGLYAADQSIIQTGGADPTVNRNILLDPSSGLPLAVGTDGNLVAVSDSGGVWCSS